MATDRVSTASTQPPAPARRRRRWLRPLLVALAALVVIAALLVVFAPAWLGRLAPGVIEDQFAARFEGRVELDRLALSWTDAQEVHGFALLDPDGAVVARGSATLPSLLDAWRLARGSADEPGRVVALAEVDLVTHADGTTNLARALAPREPSDADEPSERGDLPERSDLPPFRVEVTVERLSWRDEREAVGEGAAGVPRRVVAAPITLVAENSAAAEPDGGLSVRADATLLEPAPGSAAFALFAPTFDRGTFELTAQELPLAELDGLLALGGKLEALVGPRADAVVTAEVTVPDDAATSDDAAWTRADGEARFELRGARASLTGAAALAAGRLSLAEPIELGAPADDQVVAVFAPAALLEPGGALAGLALPADGVVAVRVTRLDADLAELARVVGTAGAPLDPARLVAAASGSFALAAEMTAPALSWRAAGGEAFELAPTRMTLERAPDGPLTLAARAEVLRPEPGALAIDAALPFTLESPALEPTLRVALDGLPVAQLDALAGQNGRLLALLGERAAATFDVTARVPRAALEATGEAAREDGVLTRTLADPALFARATMRLEAPRMNAGGAVSVEQGRLSAEAPLELALELAPGLLEALVPPQARAEGSPLSDVAFGDGARLEARLATFAMALAPLTALLEEDPAPTADAWLERLAPTIEVAAEGGAGGIAWRGPNGATATLSDLSFAFAAPAGEAASLELQAVLAGAQAVAGPASAPAGGAKPDGAFVPAGAEGVASDGATGGGISRLRVALPPLAAFAPLLAPGAEGVTLPPIAIDGELIDLPTALADRLLGTDGLLADVLGPEVDARVEGRELVLAPERPAGRVDLALTSELASARASLELETGAVVPAGDQPLDLQFALTPLSSPRLVGNLVPLVATVEPTSPTQRAALVLSDFRLPLDGDLSKLSGRLGLDLGEVVPTLFPGAASLLAGVLPQLGATRLGPYVFTIQDGRAGYEDVTMSIGGRAYSFDGSVDLGTKRIQVTTEVPLSSLGGEVGELVQRARGMIDSELSVPVQLSGTWSSPRIDVGQDTKQVLERAVKDALGRQLPGGLGDVLRRLGGGDE